MKNLQRFWLLKANRVALLLVLAGVGLSAKQAAAAAMNNPPPAGAILDLNGQTVNHGAAVTQSVNFVGAVTSTNITFAFREDPAFISFSNVSLIDNTTHSANLIMNGNFASGSGNNATDWTFVNEYGAQASGVVSNSCGGGLSTCWYDGSVQAYDAITQVVTTRIGDSYTLSFAYSDNGPLNTFSSLSTNGNVTGTGGNGIDILAYAQAGVPPPTSVTPEPSSFVLMGTGLLSVAGVLRKRFA